MDDSDGCLPMDDVRDDDSFTSVSSDQRMITVNSKSKAPADKHSEEYLRKRARNNLAVKKSRDRSKQRILETQKRVEQLTKENEDLQTRVTLLTKELNVLRALFTNGGFTVPCNLQIVASPRNEINSEKANTVVDDSRAANGTEVVNSTPSCKPEISVPITVVQQNHTSVIRSTRLPSPRLSAPELIINVPSEATAISIKQE